MNGRDADDLALRDEDAAARPLVLARARRGTRQSSRSRRIRCDLARGVLERLDAVAQARGVLEAEVAREPPQLRAQLRQRVLERLPLDALQRARRELRACGGSSAGRARSGCDEQTTLSPRRRR